MQREAVPAGKKLQLNRREGVEETDAVLVKLVDRMCITRGLERASLGLVVHGALVLAWLSGTEGGSAGTGWWCRWAGGERGPLAGWQLGSRG